MRKFLLLFLLLTTPAAAAELEQCSRPIFGHSGGESETVDLGQGFIRYASGFADQGIYASAIVFQHCYSGKTLSVTYGAGHIGGDATVSADPEHVKWVIDHAMTATEVFTFDDIAAQLEMVGAKTEVYVETEESCACAISYPHHLNGKERFDERELDRW